MNRRGFFRALIGAPMLAALPKPQTFRVTGYAVDAVPKMLRLSGGIVVGTIRAGRIGAISADQITGQIASR